MKSLRVKFAGLTFLLCIPSCMLLGTTYFTMMKLALADPSNYFESIRTVCELEGDSCQYVQGFMSFQVFIFQNIRKIYGFDYLIAHGTMLFAYLIPFISVLTGLQIYKYRQTMLLYMLSRCDSYRKEILSLCCRVSFRISSGIFIGYFLFWLFLILVTWQSGAEIGSYKFFLSEILGSRFFYDHLYLYYLMEGSIRFFFVPYAYCWLGCAVALAVNRKGDIFLFPVLFYFGISSIAGISQQSTFSSLYLNPIMIMVNQSTGGYNSLGLMGFTVVVLTVSFLFLFFYLKRVRNL